MVAGAKPDHHAVCVFAARVKGVGTCRGSLFVYGTRRRVSPRAPLVLVFTTSPDLAGVLVPRGFRRSGAVSPVCLGNTLRRRPRLPCRDRMPRLVPTRRACVPGPPMPRRVPSRARIAFSAGEGMRRRRLFRARAAKCGKNRSDEPGRDLSVVARERKPESRGVGEEQGFFSCFRREHARRSRPARMPRVWAPCAPFGLLAPSPTQ